MSMDMKPHEVRNAMRKWLDPYGFIRFKHIEHDNGVIEVRCFKGSKEYLATFPMECWENPLMQTHDYPIVSHIENQAWAILRASWGRHLRT